MALTDEGTGTTMLVQPSGFGGNGMGWGGDWAWIIILLLAFNGGWGNGFGGGNELYPWLNNSNQINDGFRDSMLNTSVTSIGDKITSGFGDLATQLCGGFAGVNAAITNAQMADMNRSFDLQSQLASCCCENRLGIANLGADIAREACADRAAVSDGIRDILTVSQANTQRILDQMCNDKIDAKNEKIADLERQLTMANLAASQGAQTARILADNAAQTSALEQYLAPVPRPAYVVQNPNCCYNPCGTNCGCGVA
jgi:hypothetical protein